MLARFVFRNFELFSKHIHRSASLGSEIERPNICTNSRLLQDPSLAHRQAMSNSRKRRGTYYIYIHSIYMTARVFFVSVVHSRRYVYIQQWWHSIRVRARIAV